MKLHRQIQGGGKFWQEGGDKLGESWEGTPFSLRQPQLEQRVELQPEPFGNADKLC